MDTYKYVRIIVKLNNYAFTIGVFTALRNTPKNSVLTKMNYWYFILFRDSIFRETDSKPVLWGLLYECNILWTSIIRDKNLKLFNKNFTSSLICMRLFQYPLFCDITL